ncbi:hypothetical protein J6590_100574 [Homalodisca vitripennis]|nr:hypothetical protein J6590_100574 [Homalodisca vitripennis]
MSTLLNYRTLKLVNPRLVENLTGAWLMYKRVLTTEEYSDQKQSGIEHTDRQRPHKTTAGHALQLPVWLWKLLSVCVLRSPPDKIAITDILIDKGQNPSDFNRSVDCKLYMLLSTLPLSNFETFGVEGTANTDVSLKSGEPYGCPGAAHHKPQISRFWGAIVGFVGFPKSQRHMCSVPSPACFDWRGWSRADFPFFRGDITETNALNVSSRISTGGGPYLQDYPSRISCYSGSSSKALHGLGAISKLLKRKNQKRDDGTSEFRVHISSVYHAEGTGN